MTHWNPLHDLVSLQDRMNRLFEDLSQRRSNDANLSDEVESADWYPAADVYESENNYVVAVDLPGIDRTTLDISIDDDRLTIKGRRNAQEATQHRRERPEGKFLRTFSVPSSVDQSGINADYKEGVLQVFLPKRSERKSQRVEINVS
ncbi:MAG TPA: Hsp20/alpha crystallin family protein [Pyrinomonadaceae bacterium]|nr:Hsp20/alpha crystallin family protein [Pyrinomonadaceae bacterium]